MKGASLQYLKGCPIIFYVCGLRRAGKLRLYGVFRVRRYKERYNKLDFFKKIAIMAAINKGPFLIGGLVSF